MKRFRSWAAVRFSMLLPLAVIALAGATIVTSNPVIQRTGHWYNGVALADQAQLRPFIKATGTRPQLAAIYIAFGSPYPAAAARRIARDGAVPLIQLDPKHETLSAIAGGGYDDYLRKFEAQRAATGIPAVIDFAHEPNGSWYPWGCPHVTAGAYLSAWRRVHADIGTTGVTWLWAVNQDIPGTCPLQPLYPGNKYVNWVGIDGYLRKPSSTFARVFGSTISEIRAFTGRPLLIAEAGAAGTDQAALITSLYAGAHATEGAIGVVYFINKTRKGDYRPTTGPSALAAYRTAVGGK